jgi:subtilisin-like proprotein convertase family protein
MWFKSTLTVIAAALLIPTISIAQTFTANPNSAINDNATTDYNLTVSGLSPSTIDTLNFGLETVCINLTHTWDSDLNIYIIAPDGTSAALTMGQGGSDDNYTNTCFNENATQSITAGSAPFTGTFRPMGEIGRVNNGQNGNGVWKLRVIDTYPADAGNLISFSITFGNSPATYTPFTDSNLPIVVINTNNQSIPNEPQIMADMGIIYNGVGVRNNMTDPFNHYNGKIGIEIRGNYSASLPQKPYRFETWDVNGNSINVPLLGMPSENDWALLATYNDKSFVRNTLANHLFDTMGHYATRSEFVEVVLNGEYQGIYMLSETIKRDNDRVDIAKLNTTDITYPQISGGYIIKTDYWDNTNSWQTSYSPIDHPGYQIHLVYDYPAPDVIVPQQQTYIQTFVYDMETALYGPNFTDTANGYRKYISERSFMDYFYVNELARNVDGYKKSCHYYKEKDDSAGNIGKLKAGPVWDFDWAWKDIWDCSIFQATDGSGWSHHINDCNTDNYSPGWMIRFLQDTTFANELNCRWFDLRRNILDTTYMFHYIDSMAAYLNEAQQRHYAYWGHMGANTGTPEVQAPRQSYQEEIDSLKSWIARRIIWMDANMPGTLNGCSFTSVNEIPSQNGSPVNAYPNPFTNEINFSIYQDRPEQISVTILNSLGQEVIVPMVIQGSTGTNYVNVPLPENLAEGIYVMRISSGNRVWTQTLIH